MPHSPFDYSRQYFENNRLNALRYGKYFPYRSISPLIAHLADSDFKATTYWTGLRKSGYSKMLIRSLLTEDDIVELRRLIKHGNFMTFYAEHYFNKKAVPTLISNEDLYRNLLGEYKLFTNKNVSEKHGYGYLVRDLAGLGLLETFNTSDKNQIEAVVTDFIETERMCPICGQKYKVIFFPDWVYKRVNGYIFLCYECPSSYPPKETVPQTIKEMVDYLGFIPNSGFQIFNNDSFASRVSEDKWTTAFSFVLKLGGKIGETTDHIKMQFGSWFKALVAAGVLDNGQLRTKRGIRCLAKSGNECNSIDEQYIDNFFFENGIKTVKEPRYPFHKLLNPKALLRADWFVNGNYVEYFGLAGESEYDLKTTNKIRLCAELGLPLIAIYPDDLADLQKSLKAVLGVNP